LVVCPNYLQAKVFETAVSLFVQKKAKGFFPLLYTLQASISKPMAITNSKRHALDGRTYCRISHQVPIRDPMGSTIPEASGFLITIKRSLDQN